LEEMPTLERKFDFAFIDPEKNSTGNTVFFGIDECKIKLSFQCGHLLQGVASDNLDFWRKCCLNDIFPANSVSSRWILKVTISDLPSFLYP